MAVRAVIIVIETARYHPDHSHRWPWGAIRFYTQSCDLRAQLNPKRLLHKNLIGRIDLKAPR